MWLLGAGASASAGIPTATDMIWEFKQRLFVSQRGASLQRVSDLSNPVVRSQLQSHIDSSGQLPSAGADTEYAGLFESVYPAEEDRRTYLESKVSGSKPSFGHIALATLMRAGLARLIWTTNFDTLVADACSQVYGATSVLTTADLNTAKMASEAILEERWPVEVKLHGDFRFRRLKNTSDELREEDSQLRSMLLDCGRRFGLIVVGYSGRDESVMDALKETITTPNAFPSGLFWLHRGDDPLAPGVSDLLKMAQRSGVDAALIRIDNFDETLRDLVRMFEGLDSKELDSFASSKRPWTAAPMPKGRRGWPVVRLNALPIEEVPSICRRVSCNIGGTRAVRDAVRESGADTIALRSRAGVLAYGADSEVRKAFEPYEITEFDIHTLEIRRQRYDSTERGLIGEALIAAIERQMGLRATKRQSRYLLAPADTSDSSWLPLKQVVGDLSGTVRGHQGLNWREGVEVHLEWANERLWLVFDPRTVFDRVTQDNRNAATAFARERSAKRYNKVLHDLLNFWSAKLSHNREELRALGIGDGIDAAFRISPTTGFSRRSGA